MSKTVLGRCLAPFFAALPLALTATAAPAETRGYVISWFATATYNDDMKTSCPDGRNGGVPELHARELVAIGFTKEQAVEVMSKSRDTTNVVPEYKNQVYNRARLDGKPVSVFNYPEFVADPDIEMYSGKYAHGFDLGGMSKESKFEDPETHQPVDNQLWRAVGCLKTFLAVPPLRPFPEELSWITIVDSAPAWAIQITGDDLSKDGPVTVVLDRTIQHLEQNAAGGPMKNASYVVDPSPTSHNVIHGEIKNGVLSITPQHIYLQGELPFYTEIELQNAHMRMTIDAEGKLTGYWGGYLDWQRYAYLYISHPGYDADAIGMYHALKKSADADPDPKTGQNKLVSAAFRMEAVPAFLLDSQGKVVAAPPHVVSAAAQ